jgi:hypothetical protein
MFRSMAKVCAMNIVPASYGFQAFDLKNDVSAVQDIIQASLHKAAFICSDWEDFIHTNVRTPCANYNTAPTCILFA